METLKLLVFVKRFVVVVAKSIGTSLVRFGRWFVRFAMLGPYKQYVTIRRTVTNRFGTAEEQLYALSGQTWLITGIVVLLVFTLVMPHSRFWTPPVYGAGTNTMFLQVVGKGEEESFFEDEVIIESAEAQQYEIAHTADPFSYGVKAGPDSLGSDNDGDIEELVGLSSGGSSVSAPMILPGAEVTPSRRDLTRYIVQQGDTISTIADKFDVTTVSILWENNLTSRSYIRPGDVLSILPITGVSHVVKRGDTLSKIIKKYDVESVEEIVRFNRLASVSDIVIGEKIVIPGGTKPRAAAPIVKSRTYAPRSYSNVAPPPPSRYAAGAGMVWPTTGHVITQYYHARHHGLDIDGHYDSPLYASDSGVVKIAGWRGGYGLSIDIDHQNGIKTRYGHASKLFVSAGDYVTKGQVIAMMGTTGYSTGTHLHFEISVNGRKVNPFTYVR